MLKNHQDSGPKSQECCSAFDPAHFLRCSRWSEHHPNDCFLLLRGIVVYYCCVALPIISPPHYTALAPQGQKEKRKRKKRIPLCFVGGQWWSSPPPLAAVVVGGIVGKPPRDQDFFQHLPCLLRGVRNLFLKTVSLLKCCVMLQKGIKTRMLFITFWCNNVSCFAINPECFPAFKALTQNHRENR